MSRARLLPTRLLMVPGIGTTLLVLLVVFCAFLLFLPASSFCIQLAQLAGLSGIHDPLVVGQGTSACTFLLVLTETRRSRPSGGAFGTAHNAVVEVAWAGHLGE